MNNSPSDALGLVQELMACYPAQPVSPANVQAYVRHLADLPMPLLAAAVQRTVASSRFFPTIAELRAAAAALVDDAPDADQAWATVMHQVARVGRTGKPELGHPRISEALAAIGTWYDVCSSETTAADRATFTKAYEAATRRAAEAVTLAAVPALPEVRRLMLAAGSEVTA
jgi:hypothetical protein